jgi:hypothetical protein
MKTIQLRCGAFAGGKVEINKIEVDDAGVVRVWDSVAGHYTTYHSLTRRTVGKIVRCMFENNMLRPINYCPPALKNV